MSGVTFMKKTMHQSGLTRLRAQQTLSNCNTMQTLMPQAQAHHQLRHTQRRTTSFATSKGAPPASPPKKVGTQQ